VLTSTRLLWTIGGCFYAKMIRRGLTQVGKSFSLHSFCFNFFPWQGLQILAIWRNGPARNFFKRHIRYLFNGKRTPLERGCFCYFPSYGVYSLYSSAFPSPRLIPLVLSPNDFLSKNFLFSSRSLWFWLLLLAERGVPKHFVIKSYNPLNVFSSFISLFPLPLHTRPFIKPYH